MPLLLPQIDSLSSKDEFFVHFVDINSGDKYRKLSEGDVVEFDAVRGKKGLKAEDYPPAVRLSSRTESSMAAAGRMPFAGSGRCTEFARDASVGRGFRSSYRPADRFECLWSSHASHVLLKG
jgi:cold shock CspA family protein